MSIRLIAVLVLAMSFVGCGPSGPELFTVQGTVTFSGEPLSNGSICFEDATAGLANSSSIDAVGKYSIKLPKGNYKVFLLPSTEEKRLPKAC